VNYTAGDVFIVGWSLLDTHTNGEDDGWAAPSKITYASTAWFVMLDAAGNPLSRGYSYT
jgi:hypothetical protein